MFQSADSRKHISLILSEVLDNIGINERMRMRAGRVSKLMETMNTITNKSIGDNVISYILGSRSEGTTTSGLESDTDQLVCLHDYNVIQDWSEWEHGKRNYFMIQDENTTPGHCFLQLLKHYKRLPATAIPDDRHITDRRGRILHRNTICNFDILKHGTRHGPSIATQGPQGLNYSEYVYAYPCKSWPTSASSSWLERRGIGKWPTQKIKRNTVRTRCYVVPTGSKTSEYPELEWRLSTSLAESRLMFDLNIAQVKCYVLLKMILKSFLNPRGDINISSFMCKTVLLHCIENKEPSIWEENNLLECLKDCLMELSSCVQNDNLSHFIIPENNLMAGQFTAETKHQLLKTISDFIQNDVQSLLRIDIDNLGQRLQVKLNLVPKQYNSYFLQDICGRSSACSYLTFSRSRSKNYRIQLKKIHNKNIRRMKHYLERLMTYNNNNNELEHAAFTFLAPLLCTTYGSALASASIGLKHQVSPQAFVWLLEGLDSDILSGRLKLSSVFYSAGDLEKAKIILRHTERQYYSYPVVPICSCWYPMPPQELTRELRSECNEKNEDCVKNITALCVIFLKQEINCIPYELQYEMFRSTKDDMKHKDQDEDFWMNWAVVDSLPFLYFLQYKVYRHLQRYHDQQQALFKLANIIQTDKNLRHKDTALNVLGQCLVQENRHKQAIQCYLLSLQERARNNVAKIHICRLLSSLLFCMEN